MPRRQTTHSNTYRFFVPPECFDGEDVRIDDPDLARQIGAVLRLGPGDQIVLLDGAGWCYDVALTAVTRGQIRATVVRGALAAGEPRLALTLYAGLMRAERFEWLLQKGTELGVSVFIPVICEHSIADGAMSAARFARWGRILREAAEQSRRGRLPRLESPLSFMEACTRATSGPALLLWEGEGAESLRGVLRRLATVQPPATLALFSGPEGGLSPAERAAATAHAIMSATLGPRTLRAETAPIAAAAAAFYEYGDLGD